MSRLTPEILDQVEKSVQGSCNSLQESFDRANDYYAWGFEFDDLTPDEEMELCAFIDTLHFECVRCGWWCEMGDFNDEACVASGENICSQCED